MVKTIARWKRHARTSERNGNELSAPLSDKRLTESSAKTCSLEGWCWKGGIAYRGRGHCHRDCSRPCNCRTSMGSCNCHSYLDILMCAQSKDRRLGKGHEREHTDAVAVFEIVTA